MSRITNEASKVDAIVDVNRAQIEHRATWMGLIFDEMRKAGVADAEQIVRRAIRRCGQFHGKRNFHDVMEDKSSCVDFDKVFQTGVGPDTFNMKNFSSDADNMKVEFNYCALVSAWQTPMTKAPKALSTVPSRLFPRPCSKAACRWPRVVNSTKPLPRSPKPPNWPSSTAMPPF